MLDDAFFDRDARIVARELLGKLLRRRLGQRWLTVRVTETEAYLLDDKASHASLGRTPSREPLFMPAGTIYLYHSRGGDSFNISTQGPGDAVLIKAGIPWVDARTAPDAISTMQSRNPVRGSKREREPHRLCAGQTLLCASLDLKIREWTGRRLDREALYFDEGEAPEAVIVARRLGIRKDRDAQLMYRYLHAAHLDAVTDDPTRKRRLVEGRDWLLLRGGDEDPSLTFPP